MALNLLNDNNDGDGEREGEGSGGLFSERSKPRSRHAVLQQMCWSQVRASKQMSRGALSCPGQPEHRSVTSVCSLRCSTFLTVLMNRFAQQQGGIPCACVCAFENPIFILEQ